jgi:hypothetical protein
MKRTLLSLTSSLLVVLVMASCASPDRIPNGQTEAEVRQRYGTPLAEVPIPGGKRLQYVAPPFAQTGYMVDLDASGRVVRAEQVMDDAHFGRVKIGQDTMATVERDFGPPSRVSFYRVSGRNPVWNYKYVQTAFPMMMSVYFDERGVVSRLESGPDPDYDRGVDRK